MSTAKKTTVKKSATTAKKAVRKSVPKKSTPKKMVSKVSVPRYPACRRPNANILKARVEIVKDVKSMILAGALKVQQGNTYVEFKQEISPNDVRRSVPMEKIMEGATVCALGAMFVAEVNKNNTLYADNIGCDGLYARGSCTDRLRAYFTAQEMQQIEDCFEGTADFDSPQGSTTYSELYPGPATCLLAICDNIIRNKGAFRPKQDIPKDLRANVAAGPQCKKLIAKLGTNLYRPSSIGLDDDTDYDLVSGVRVLPEKTAVEVLRLIAIQDKYMAIENRLEKKNAR